MVAATANGADGPPPSDAQLQQLRRFFQEGFLTQAEYDSRRLALIDQLTRPAPPSLLTHFYPAGVGAMLPRNRSVLLGATVVMHALYHVCVTQMATALWIYLPFWAALPLAAPLAISSAVEVGSASPAALLAFHRSFSRVLTLVFMILSSITVEVCFSGWRQYQAYGRQRFDGVFFGTCLTALVLFVVHCGVGIALRSFPAHSPLSGIAAAVPQRPRALLGLSAAYIVTIHPCMAVYAMIPITPLSVALVLPVGLLGAVVAARARKVRWMHIGIALFAFAACSPLAIASFLLVAPVAALATVLLVMVTPLSKSGLARTPSAAPLPAAAAVPTEENQGSEAADLSGAVADAAGASDGAVANGPAGAGEPEMSSAVVVPVADEPAGDSRHDANRYSPWHIVACVLIVVVQFPLALAWDVPLFDGPCTGIGLGLLFASLFLTFPPQLGFARRYLHALLACIALGVWAVAIAIESPGQQRWYDVGTRPFEVLHTSPVFGAIILPGHDQRYYIYDLDQITFSGTRVISSVGQCNNLYLSRGTTFSCNASRFELHSDTYGDGVNCDHPPCYYHVPRSGMYRLSASIERPADWDWRPDENRQRGGGDWRRSAVAVLTNFRAPGLFDTASSERPYRLDFGRSRTRRLVLLPRDLSGPCESNNNNNPSFWGWRGAVVSAQRVGAIFYLPSAFVWAAYWLRNDAPARAPLAALVVVPLVVLGAGCALVGPIALLSAAFAALALALRVLDLPQFAALEARLEDSWSSTVSVLAGDAADDDGAE